MLITFRKGEAQMQDLRSFVRRFAAVIPASLSKVLSSHVVVALVCLGFVPATAAFSATLSVATSSLPNATMNVAYNQTFMASGGTGTGYTWTVTAGATGLANVGLTLSSGGVLSGVAGAAGSAAFTAQVKDSGGNKASANLSVTVVYPITVIAVLPNAVVKQYYSANLMAEGGSGSGYSWALASGSLPTWLTMSGAGELFGTPTTAGASTFTVKVTDSAGNSATDAVTITVNSALSIVTTSLPNADQWSDYDTAVTAAGGVPPYTWKVNNVAVSSALGDNWSNWTTIATGYPWASNSVPVITVAGNGAAGFSGNGGPAVEATLTDLGGLAVGASGNLYIADETTNRVRMVSGSSDKIFAEAGTGSAGYNGDGIAATTAQLSSPWGIAVDKSGNLYIADTGNNRIRMVTAATGKISTVAGTGMPGYNGDNISATTAKLFAPMAVALDKNGNLYIADSGNNRIRMVTVATGKISTVAGTGASGYTGDGGPATQATLGNPSAIAVDSALNFYIIDGNGAHLREVTVSTGKISTLPGYFANSTGYVGVAVDPAGNVYVSGNSFFGDGWISILPKGGTSSFTFMGNLINNAAGTYYLGSYGEDVPAFYAEVSSPQGVAADSVGNLYIADTGNNRVRRLPNPAVESDLIFGDGGFQSAGAYTLNVTVTDSAKATASASYPITVNGTMSVPTSNPTSLHTATTGQAYSGYVSAIGGTAPYTWTVSNLVDGFTWSNDGGSALAISGTPRLGGQLTFYPTVTDATGDQASPNQGYTITITNGPLTLPSPTAAALPSAAQGQAFTASIVATGGIPGYFWTNMNSGGSPSYTWTVNGTQFSPQNGGSVNLSNGLTVANSGGTEKLTITGTPNSSSTVTFTASIKDSTGISTGPVTYTIPGSQGLSGNISFINVCQNVPMPAITVTINTSPVRTTTTKNGNGNFSFPNLPAGTYKITPSISGPESMFYPASQTVTVSNGTQLSNVNFQVSLGYTLSGTASYTGAKTGRIYLEVVGNNCGGQGTSLAAPGAFTIRGIPPGNYGLSAWMDNLGYGQPNASNPTGTYNSVNVTAGNQSGVAIALQDAAAVTLSSPPSIQGVSAFESGAFVGYNPITNSSEVELPASYTVQWSTTKAFSSVAGSHSFPATGANSNGAMFVTGLADHSVYYFRIRGNAGTASSQWSAAAGPVTIGPPSTGYTVSGTVTFQGTVTGPLYAGLYNQQTSQVYADVIEHPVSPQSWSVKVPAAPDYFEFGIIDQNNDGLIDAGDIQNTNGPGGKNVTVSGNLQNQDISLPSANSDISASTYISRNFNQAGYWNQVGFYVDTGVKLPVAVTLAAPAPNLFAPVDIGQCGNCGGDLFEYWMGISGDMPKVGDSYTFDLTYSDRTTEAVTAKVSGVPNVFMTAMAPTGNGVSTTPKFTWTCPSGASAYTYSFTLWDQNGNTIWQIPGNNCKSNGFSSSVTSLTWGVDPTDCGSKPTVSALANGAKYQWNIAANDANSNASSTQTGFVTEGSGALTLPTSDPSTLPSAIVNQPYNGTITATGGEPPYTWTVTGLSDYLGWGTQNPTQNVLDINGTPSQLTTVTFQAKVKDSAGTVAGPVTYTIHVVQAAPVGLPAPSSDPLGAGIAGLAYSGALNASGGAGGFEFKVNGTTIPTNMTYTAPASGGGGLTFANSGGDTLWVDGTPASAGTITLTVEVIDTSNANDTATATYSVPVAAGPNGANNANLKGQYTCLIQGYKDNSQARNASLATATADGSGHFTNGIFDNNSRQNSAEVEGTLSGTYSIGADNNGMASLTAVVPSNGSMTSSWLLALGDGVPAKEFREIEVDSAGEHAIGDCYLATPAAFTSSNVNGGAWVFGMYGENGSGSPKVLAGRFVASSAPSGTTPGNLTNGIIDGSKGGDTAIGTANFTGTWTAPNASTGRFTATLAVGSSNSSEVVYLIDASRAFILDTTAGKGALSGQLRKQQQSSYSLSSLSGGFVSYFEAFEFGGSSNGMPTGSGASLMVGRGSSSGITIDASYSDYDGSYEKGQENGGPIPLTFDTANPGRATFPAGSSGTGYFYLFNNANGFFLDIDNNGEIDFGYSEAQTQTTFTDAALAGTYAMGEMPRLVWDDNQNVGVFKLGSAGNITGEISQAGVGSSSFDQSGSLTYNWDSATYGTFLMNISGKSNGLSCAVVTSTRFVCMEQASQNGHMMIFQE